MTQPTKLPDELFPDHAWSIADYPQRVMMLAVRFAQVTEQARIYLDDLRDLRERNADLVNEIEHLQEVKRDLSIRLERLRPTPMQDPL